jgi:hypothetical protein
MKKLMILFMAAGLVYCQPVTTGANPQVELGASLYNMGTVRVYTGTGAPGTVVTPSGTPPQQGDFYIDTVGKVVYQCIPASCVSSGWSRTSQAISVTSFGINGTSTDASNFNTAISATAGSACLYIPSGVTVNLTNNSVTVLTNTCITGDGPLSKIQAAGLSSPGLGVLDIASGQSNIRLNNFLIDGGTTTPVPIAYSTATANGPMYSGFTTGSTIWAHGGNTNITLSYVTISHTNGYAVLFDSRTAAISNVLLTHFTDINARPNLFGATTGAANYGSWTGGVLFSIDGTGAVYTRDITVEHSLWQNVVGNCLWMAHTGTTGPANGINFKFIDNTFIDVGLDAILVSGVDGYTETNNRVQRGGYVVTSDVGATRVGGPMWLQGFSPVAFDTYFPLHNFVRSNNWAMECGGLAALDGAYNGVFSGNTVESPWFSDDPLASNSTCGPSGNVGTNFVGGVTTANSANASNGPQHIIISGNAFLGVGYSSVALYPCYQCTVTNNNIFQWATTANPIVLANISTSSNGHSYQNVVSNNNIYWFPSSSSPAIIENCQPSGGSCQYPQFTNDFNFVMNNRVVGNTFEFQRNPSNSSNGNASISGSGTLMLNSVSTGNVLPINAIAIQAEGTGNPYLQIYQNNGTGLNLASFTATGNKDMVVHFSNLPLVVGAGYRVYCDDCTTAATCAGGGTGHQAVTNATVWTCN